MKLAITIIVVLFLHKGLISDFCLRDLMSAYNLNGEVFPNHNKVPFCPTIKENCCTESDMLEVYEKYQGVLKPRLESYNDQYKDEIDRMERMYLKILKLEQRRTWMDGQRQYCENTYRNFTAFPFQKLLTQLRIGIDVSSDVFSKVHESFLCVFCDYEAQKSFMLETEQVAQDAGVCLDVITKNLEFLVTQNHLLVK